MLTIIAAGTVLSWLATEPRVVYWQNRLWQQLPRRRATATGLLLLIAAILGSATAPVRAADDRFSAYQQKVLFNPGESVRKAEARGRVTIYDGVDEQQVEAAMDTQFERIEHMMFVRVRRSSEDGTASYDDDGCD